MIEEQLIIEVAAHASEVRVKVLPPLCPLAVSAADFSHAEQLIARARRATARWLVEGGPELPDQERFLALHHHPNQGPPPKRVTAPTGRTTTAQSDDQHSGAHPT